MTPDWIPTASVVAGMYGGYRAENWGSNLSKMDHSRIQLHFSSKMTV